MTEPLLEARGVTKSFGGVRALRGADFAVHPGEVAALVGDNGAGKSTLVKILSGTLAPDGGEIWFEGRQVTVPNPVAARELGIETVYQDLALAPELDPAANLFLGRELVRPGPLGRLGFLDKAGMRRRTNKAFADLGIGLQDTGAMVANLSGGQRQSVAVSRAATWVSKVVFMDEPTAALGVVQSARVRDLVRRVRDSGIGVVSCWWLLGRDAMMIGGHGRLVWKPGSMSRLLDRLRLCVRSLPRSWSSRPPVRGCKPESGPARTTPRCSIWSASTWVGWPAAILPAAARWGRAPTTAPTASGP